MPTLRDGPDPTASAPKGATPLLSHITSSEGQEETPRGKCETLGGFLR
jgi:hypothetical protein